MKNMKRKLTALLLCVAMLAIAVVGGTMAYFTDTEEATNVFTVGNIDIELHESTRDGKKDKDYQQWLKETTMMPGVPLDKIVWVENTGNNPAYVRVTITIPEQMTATWNTASGWSITNPNGDNVWVLTTTEPLAKGASTPELLQAVQLKPEVTSVTAASSYNVDVKVEAIQSEGFADSVAAYAALDGTNVAETTSAGNIDEANTALAAGDAVVQLSADITASKAVTMGDQTVLDGNGNTITKNAVDTAQYNAGVQTAGGTIKNVTVTGASNGDGKGFRAVYVTSKLDADLVVADADLNGTYALNVNGSSDTYKLLVTNSKLRGWTSYGQIAGAEFTDCTFYWNNEGTFGHLRPHADTVLTNCKFDTTGNSKYTMAAGVAGITVELNNCTYDNTPITAANFADLFDVTGSDEFVTYLKNSTVIVDGVTVAF